MIDKLLLHAKTHRQAERFISLPSHALLIHGPRGSGKSFLAETIAAALVGRSAANLGSYPYFMLIEKPLGRQEIPIEVVRQLIKDLRLKAAAAEGKPATRLVLIDGAHYLSEEAQNALLKLIEEPGRDTIFILASISADSLLPTIVSRVQKLAVFPVGLAAAKEYYKNDYPAAAVENAWHMSQGAPGLMSALLQQDLQHDFRQAVEEVKQLLKKDAYEKVLYWDVLSADKERLMLALDALGLILAALHRTAVQRGAAAQIKRLSAARRLIAGSAEALSRNTSPRLVCLNLALNLRV